MAPPAVYGRAYGFEGAMDNLGAVGGPLIAIGLVGLAGVRSAILSSVIPGPAVLAIVYAIRHAPRLAVHERRRSVLAFDRWFAVSWAGCWRSQRHLN